MWIVLGADGPWDLPLDGFEVLEVTFAYPLDIVAWGPEGVHVKVRLESAFAFHDPIIGQRALDANKDSWEDLSIVLSLRHDRFTRVTANASAQLSIDFASGRRIIAGPDPDFENWAITGLGFQLIPLPGG